MIRVAISLMIFTLWTASAHAEEEDLCKDPTALYQRAEKEPYLGQAIFWIHNVLSAQPYGYTSSITKCDRKRLTTDGDSTYTLTVRYVRAGDTPIDTLEMTIGTTYLNGFELDRVNLAAPAWAIKANDLSGLNSEWIRSETKQIQVAGDLDADTTIIASLARNIEYMLRNQQPIVTERFIDVRIVKKSGLEEGWVVRKSLHNADLDRKKHAIDLTRRAYNFGDRPFEANAYTGDVFELDLLDAYSGPH